MNRRGSVPLMVAVLIVTLAGGAGVVIDGARAWVVEARLQSAVDAASLVAARRIEEPTRDVEATRAFWASLGQAGRPTDYLGATISAPVVRTDPDDRNQVRVSATATLETTLFSIIRPHDGR